MVCVRLNVSPGSLRASFQKIHPFQRFSSVRTHPSKLLAVCVWDERYVNLPTTFDVLDN